MLPKIAIGAIILIIVGLLFFDFGFLTSKFFNNSKTQGPASISGVIKLNGQIPQGSSISIGAREHGTDGNFNIFASGLAATDETAWQYNNAQSGKSYELQAYLNDNNSVAATSDVLDVTAPATEEEITLNVESQTPAPEPASISGVVYINGYIPPGATFDILGKKYNATGDYSVVVQDLSATVKRTMTYANAISGQKYEVIGKLYSSSGQLIGISLPVAIAAPTDNAVLTINSNAAPPVGAITPIQTTASAPAASATPAASGLPTGNASISGTINFNGSAPSGSSIVILAAPSGTSNQYQTVVSGISPTNGTSWTWNGAAAGTIYQMIAVLKAPTSGNSSTYDVADSQTYTVAAPAINQLFTLNTGFSLGTPQGPVFPTCNTHNSNNTWNVTVNFTNVQGAQYYVLQLGSTSGGNNIDNVSQPAQPGNNQTINAVINDSVTYYAQYAVASVPNPTPAQLSPFGGPFTIRCP